jgi:hypothetical protein
MMEFLTCIRALIRNRGFPREAMDHVKLDLNARGERLPPTAPLDAPARTEVNGICSSAGRPMNLLMPLLKGS